MFGTDSPFGDSIIPSFLLLAIAMAVIDGPNLIERIFSIDAGIQSGFKAAMAAVGIGRMASGTLHGLAHGVSSIGKGVNRFADSAVPLQQQRISDPPCAQPHMGLCKCIQGRRKCCKRYSKTSWIFRPEVSDHCREEARNSGCLPKVIYQFPTSCSPAI